MLTTININFLLMLHEGCGLAVTLPTSAGLHVSSNSWALAGEQPLSGACSSHGEERSRGMAISKPRTYTGPYYPIDQSRSHGLAPNPQGREVNSASMKAQQGQGGNSIYLKNACWNYCRPFLGSPIISSTCQFRLEINYF